MVYEVYDLGYDDATPAFVVSVLQVHRNIRHLSHRIYVQRGSRL